MEGRQLREAGKETVEQFKEGTDMGAHFVCTVVAVATVARNDLCDSHGSQFASLFYTT